MSRVLEMQMQIERSYERQRYNAILKELQELQHKQQQEKFGEIQNPYALLPRIDDAIKRKDAASVWDISAQITSLWRNTFK